MWTEVPDPNGNEKLVVEEFFQSAAAKTELINEGTGLWAGLKLVLAIGAPHLGTILAFCCAACLPRLAKMLKKGGCCVVESTTEAKTAKAEGEPGPMCVGFWQGWELQELGQALLDALVMGNGEVAGQVRTQPA